MIKLPSIWHNRAEKNYRPTHIGAATDATFIQQHYHKLAVTPLPADKHALAQPPLLAPAEAREIRKAQRAAGKLSSRDHVWRRAALSGERMSGRKRVTGS